VLAGGMAPIADEVMGRFFSPQTLARRTPAVADVEGWVRITRLLAAPATSRRVPRLTLVERPTTEAVPDRQRLPLINGVPAVGRTRTFCQVKVQATPLLLGTVTVKMS